MALMEISVVPLGTGTPSVGSYVARIKTFLEEKGVPHRLTDMGTIVEGEARELLKLAAELHELPFQAGVKRVYTVIKLDDRRDRKVHLGEKVKSVEERLSPKG